MSAAANCHDLRTLSQFLGFSPQHLYYLASSKPFLYKKILISKGSSPESSREIFVPISELKGVQRVILRRILEVESVSEFACAYVKGKSVVGSAKRLCGTKAVLRVDINNFFPSIVGKRVYGLFSSLGFNSRISGILSRLVTYEGRLIQGSPTSPYIANLICRKLDAQLASLSSGWNIEYLRYSDDMFFSSKVNFNHVRFKDSVRSIIGWNGFSINDAKSRFFALGQPRKTLGLITHGESAAIPIVARKRIRAMFFNASRSTKADQAELEKLRGNLEWYKSVYGRTETSLEYERILSTVQSLRFHQTFLT